MDTATGPCSVALWKKGAIAAYVENRKPVMQSACLLPMIEDVLAQSNTTYGNLTALAATTGPGSFTGIRVALAAARAICFAAQIPGMGYTSLQVLAYAARQDTKQPVLALLNAGKGEHYYQYYQSQPWKPLCDPQLGPQLGPLPAALQKAPPCEVLLSGNVPVEETRFTHSGITFPGADWLARLAAAHPQPGRDELRPFYIRPPDAKLPQTNP